ncbi:MAG TPA: hypothetical protein VF120_02785 [Ktedonobacterales bacterium]
MFVLMFASLTWIVLWHPLAIYVATFTAIFFVAAELDSIYVLLRGTSSYARAFGLFLVMLGVTVCLAGGILSPFTHNPSVTYTFWIEVGTASATFVLFRPLTQLARMSAARSILDEGKHAAIELIQPGATFLLGNGRVVDATAGTHGPSGDSRAPGDADDDDTRVAYARNLLIQSQHQAAVMFKALNPWMWGSLLVFVLLYHTFASTPDILARLSDNFITVFLAAVAAFLAVLALFVGKTFEASRDVLLVLAVVIALTAVGDVILNANADASGTITALPGTLQAVINDRHFLLVTIHSILQEFLVLLALGQAYFLGVVLYARLKEHEERIKSRY